MSLPTASDRAGFVTTNKMEQNMADQRQIEYQPKKQKKQLELLTLHFFMVFELHHFQHTISS
jgi:hypothetical protein